LVSVVLLYANSRLLPQNSQEEGSGQTNSFNTKMVRTSVKTISYSSGSRKYAASRKSVARAAALIRKRMAGTPRAPMRTGGFYGLYDRRGRNELKVIDTDQALSTTVAVGGTITLINGIAQGTDYNQRIGRKILMKSIFSKFFLVPNSTLNQVQGNIVRVMVFYDSQTNGSAPAVSDVLTTGVYDSPLNLNNRDRFKIIIDKYYTMGAAVYTSGALTAGSPYPTYCKKFKKCSLEVVFGGTGATVGSIQSGGLFMLTIAAIDSITWCDTYHRVRFLDS